MKKTLHSLLAVVVILFSAFDCYAQNERADELKAIAAKNGIWNTSYNNRDSLSFYALFDTAAIFTSAGANLIGLENCKLLCQAL